MPRLDHFKQRRARPHIAGVSGSYSVNGPHRVHAGDDVKFSLWYSDDRRMARKLGEPPAEPGRGAPW